MSQESPRAHMQRQTPRSRPERSQEELRADLEQKFRALRPTLNTAIAEYECALEDGSFNDAPGESEGSGETRKSALQRKIQGIVERGERMKHALATRDYESVLSPETNPIDYANYAQNVDQSKAGEEWKLYPESSHIDSETAKPFVPDLSGFNGKPCTEVFQHVLDTYGDTHYIPGKEYRDWLAVHPQETPSELKDPDVWFFFPGSLLRDEVGHWDVPYARWNGLRWGRSAAWLSNGWSSRYRVVLLEKWV